MARRSTKKFEFAKGVYYFNINKGYNNNITIKRMDKDAALHAYNGYLRTFKDKCEWLGKWDGKKFVEDNYEELAESLAATAK
ncbi:MAG: hypothetical protein R3301_10885 [Saprospiraceae bacterium]|nr:hypothetical protein [Saprospiraceae bacterium]